MTRELLHGGCLANVAWEFEKLGIRVEMCLPPRGRLAAPGKQFLQSNGGNQTVLLRARWPISLRK
jgi:hypothetical protein